MSSKSDNDPCLNLRCKQMFYEVDEFDGTKPEKPYGGGDASAYWCECTQTGRGPDDKPVDRKQCSSPLRKCFEGIHSIT